MAGVPRPYNVACGPWTPPGMQCPWPPEEFVCDGGAARIVDFMPTEGGRCDVVRIIEGIDGEVPFEMLLDVRFGFGADSPLIEKTADGTCFLAGPDALVLRGPAPLSPGMRVLIDARTSYRNDCTF